MKTLSNWKPCLILGGALAFVACGDDDDDDDGGRAGAAGARNMGGMGGRGGTTGGTGVEAGTAGTIGGSVSPGGAPSEAGTGGSDVMGGATGEAGAAGAAAGAGGDGAGGAATEELTDAQIVLVLDTLNQGEVEVAYAALPHLALPAVQAFAQEMIGDHSAARQAVLSTASSLDLVPQPSPVHRALKQEAELLIEEFHQSMSDMLDEPYIDSQVVAHAEALVLLSELESAADAAALQDLISMLSVDVQAHYDAAVSIQQGLE